MILKSYVLVTVNRKQKTFHINDEVDFPTLLLLAGNNPKFTEALITRVRLAE